MYSQRSAGQRPDHTVGGNLIVRRFNGRSVYGANFSHCKIYRLDSKTKCVWNTLTLYIYAQNFRLFTYFIYAHGERMGFVLSSLPAWMLLGTYVSNARRLPFTPFPFNFILYSKIFWLGLRQKIVLFETHENRFIFPSGLSWTSGMNYNCNISKWTRFNQFKLR